MSLVAFATAPHNQKGIRANCPVVSAVIKAVLANTYGVNEICKYPLTNSNYLNNLSFVKDFLSYIKQREMTLKNLFI